MRVSLLISLSLFFQSGSANVEVGRLPTLAHGVSGTLVFTSPTQLRIDNFNYDGQGPGSEQANTFVYYYRPGATANRFGGGIVVPLPSPQGMTDGRFTVGRRYTDSTLTVDLPDDTTVCDIGTFTIWCRLASSFFTTIEIPESTYRTSGGQCILNTLTNTPTEAPSSFVNCELLSPSLRLQWGVAEDEGSIDYRICGCRAMVSEQNQYMGFGLSGSDSSTLMVGSDVTIAWIDSIEGIPNAEDYYLTAQSPCRAGMGVCPDTMVADEDCSNDITAVSGSVNNREQCVLFTRPLLASDTCDITLDPNITEQYIVWAIGGLGETAFVHFSRADPTAEPLHLGRDPVDNCRDTTLTCEGCPPFEGQRMEYRESTTFSFRIGPSGVERGYMAITEQAGWGIAWYVNGTLIPELFLERGVTYTFIVEGGTEDNDLASYHPLYITSSKNGGRLSNIQVDEDEVVYAGLDGEDNPVATGRLCQLIETSAAVNIREGCGELSDYQSALNLTCQEGSPGVFTWTPDQNTPDIVYYQCGTHMNLGWRINFSGELALVPSLGSIISIILMTLIITLL